MPDGEGGFKSTASRLAALAARGTGSPENDSSPQDDAAMTCPSCAEPEQGQHSGDVAQVNAALEAAVAKSRAEFLRRLAEYQGKLGCDSIAAHDAQQQVASFSLNTRLDDAQFIAHRIAGLGLTLGFGELGDTARQTEAAIMAFRKDQSADRCQAAFLQIAELCSSIDTARRAERHPA